jgi:hypothetical protein
LAAGALGSSGTQLPISSADSSLSLSGGGGSSGKRINKERQGDEKARRVFCRLNFLSYTTLDMIRELRQQFFQLLQEIGFAAAASHPSDPAFNRNSENIAVLKAVLCAGLYPNVVKGRWQCTFYMTLARSNKTINYVQQTLQETLKADQKLQSSFPRSRKYPSILVPSTLAKSTLITTGLSITKKLKLQKYVANWFPVYNVFANKHIPWIMQ